MRDGYTRVLPSGPVSKIASNRSPKRLAYHPGRVRCINRRKLMHQTFSFVIGKPYCSIFKMEPDSILTARIGPASHAEKKRLIDFKMVANYFTKTVLHTCFVSCADGLAEADKSAPAGGSAGRIHRSHLDISLF
jgi:hypothetical protein